MYFFGQILLFSAETSEIPWLRLMIPTEIAVLLVKISDFSLESK